MSWIKWTFAQNLFYGMITATVAGSVLVILMMLLEQTPQYRNSRLKLLWMKLAQILYLFPIMALVVILTRASFSVNGSIAWTSDFWRASTPPVRSTYRIFMIIWLVGLLFGVMFRILQFWKLHEILKGNISIENELCQRMIGEYQTKYQLKTIAFYQNDMIEFPICVGDFRPRIILPVKEYTEKELHMVLEHELHHIKNHDLAWKKVGLVTTFIHWWNPIVYFLLYKMILQEEIECDIRTCESNKYFTMKEYGFYLSGMSESQDDMIFVSALCKSKKDLFRRLEGMVKGKKITKKMIMVSCCILATLAAVPSYAAAESVARINEKWMMETETGMEEVQIDFAALEITGHVSDDPDVEEIDLTLEQKTLPYSTLVSLDRTISANTRVLYLWKDMQAGNQISIMARCPDGSIVYRIGIKEQNGTMSYIQGSGNLSHIFTIQTNGSYTAYVENRSNISMKVTGDAAYSN